MIQGLTMRTSQLLVFIAAILIPATSHGQTLSIGSITGGADLHGLYNDGLTFSLANDGPQSVGSSQISVSTNVYYDGESLYGFASQSSDITLSGNNLTVSGNATIENGAVYATNAAGWVEWENYDAYMQVCFSLTSPFYYSLRANVAYRTSSSFVISAGWVTLNGNMLFGQSAPASGSIGGVLPAGNYTFEAYTGGGVGWGIPTGLEYEVLLSVSPSNIVSTTVSGQITDASTLLPIPNAAVQIGYLSTVSDVNGYYSQSNLPPNTYTVVVNPANYIGATNTVTTTASETNVTDDFFLTPLVTVSGQVTCTCDGSPIVNASLQIGNTFANYSATSGSSGNYSITGIPPGTYTATVSANNYVTANTTVTIATGVSSVTQNFELSPMPTITFYHQPGDDNNGAGHAFLSLRWENCETKFWGFYSTGWANEILGVTPGIVDGGEPNWDFSISYPITVVEYDSAATVITQDKISPPWYSLLTFNCMNWAIKVANAAGVELPSSHDNAGFADPRTFGASLENIGNGNTKYGGLVREYDSPDPVTPFDYSYSGLESAGHTNAAGLATSIGLAYNLVNLGTVNANNIRGLSMGLSGVATNQDLISMNWGDGSAFQEQSLGFSHIYSNGTYHADLLVIDAGAVHSYTMTVSVSSSAAPSIAVNVTAFPPATITNQGFVLASPVPDFNIAQLTSISILSNGQAVLNFLGVPAWTYTIEATSDLTQAFSPIGSGTAGTDGTFQYTDLAAVGAKARFYRASYP
jgi:hypothetical protein